VVDACFAAISSGVGYYAATNDICGVGLSCGDIGTLDVSLVTEMKDLFDGDASFNADISAWNTAAVTDMF
jgi:surface protein